MKRIICFHLYNDFSGSPKVLSMVLKGLLRCGCRVDLVSSCGGILDGLENWSGLEKHSYWYAFSDNKVLAMLRYGSVQVYTFLLAFRYLFSRDCVFYINTLLPVGPALAGRIMGKRVIYHYHENAFAKGMFYKTLAWMMQRLAHKIICVSAYQKSFLKRRQGVVVVPNALPDEFVGRLYPDPQAAFERKTVLMLGSLKSYKGTLEFIRIASMMPQYNFELVLNDSNDNIGKYLSGRGISLSENIHIYPRQSDVSDFYNRASIVLNLSNKDFFIETFGLTALEAMSAGLPVIVPTVGGIAEIVEDGVNGYKIDIQNQYHIIKKIQIMLEDKDLYVRLSRNALNFSQHFSEAGMVKSVCNILFS